MHKDWGTGVCLATNEIVVACTMVQIVVFPREHHHLQVTKESYRSIISSVFLLPCLCGLAIYDLYHKHRYTYWIWFWFSSRLDLSWRISWSLLLRRSNNRFVSAAVWPLDAVFEEGLEESGTTCRWLGRFIRDVDVPGWCSYDLIRV